MSKNCILRPLVTVIYIQASHPALQGGLKGTRAGSPMRASVLLSVQCEYSDKLAEMIYSHSHFPHHTPYCLETKLTNRPKTDAVQLYQLLKLKLSMVNGPKHCVAYDILLNAMKEWPSDQRTYTNLFSQPPTSLLFPSSLQRDILPLYCFLWFVIK